MNQSLLKISLGCLLSACPAVPMLVQAGEAPTEKADPTTKPAEVAVKADSAKSGSALEIRAMQEFARGSYSTALPLLKQVADELKNDPDRLGPIQEAIRVSEKNIGAEQAAADAQARANNPLAPREPAAKAGPRVPHPAPKAGEIPEMTIKELGNFEYDTEKGGTIPTDVKAMDKSKIKLKGFMIPIDQADSITSFAMVPSLFNCCFGQPPQIQHTIVVKVPTGKAVSYYPDELVVQGTLSVEEKKEDGFIISVFELTADSVKPTPK